MMMTSLGHLAWRIRRRMDMNNLFGRAAVIIGIILLQPTGILLQRALHPLCLKICWGGNHQCWIVPHQILKWRGKFHHLGHTVLPSAPRQHNTNRHPCLDRQACMLFPQACKFILPCLVKHALFFGRNFSYESHAGSNHDKSVSHFFLNVKHFCFLNRLNKEVNVAGDSQLPSDNWDTEKPDQEVSTSHVTNEKWSIEKQQPSIRSDFVEEEDSEYKTVHEGGKKTSKKDGDWLSRLLARSQAQVVSQTHHGASRDAIEHSSHSEPHAVEETLKSGPDSNIANRHQKGSLSSSKSDFLGLKDANDDEDEDSFTGIIPNSSKVVGMITSSGLHKGQLKEPQPNQQPSSSQSTRPDEHAHDVGILQKMENVVSKESIHSGAPMSNLKQHSGGSVDGYVFGNSVRIQGASSFQNEQLAGQDQCTAPVQSGMKTGAMKECLTSTPHTSKNALQFAEPTFSSLAVDHSSEKQLHAARDVVIKLHQLEVENVQLKALLETQQTRHEQEFTSLEDMYKWRNKLQAESMDLREARLQAEINELTAMLKTIQNESEAERTRLLEASAQRLADADRERNRDFERLRELQRKAVSEMQKDYEEQMQRLRRLKDQEVDAVTSATAQTRSLSTVIEHMEAFSQRLAELASQLDSYRQHSRQDADFEMRQREQQIKGGLLGCWLQILFNVLMLRLVLQVKCCALQHSDGRKGR
uniref:Fas-binding factor 1 C-terminal domain-containing protein n=1 Tax=Eptatretus burgeri TaxID=7764 RepID=A0A8C4QRP3_EPTBU